MEEKLTCSSCKKKWTRTKSRGRKPTICPKCVKKQTVKMVEIKPVEVVEEKKQEVTKQSISLVDVYREIYPRPTNYVEFIESTKKGSHWHCSSCKASIKVDVPLITPPTHYCPPKSTKIKEYERVS